MLPPRMSDVEEVKARINIVDIVGGRVKLKKAGRNFKGLCPFHSEKTPSFIVSPDRQTFHCFGCGKGGSVIDFVMEYERVDFVEALEELAGIAGVKLERRGYETPESKRKETLYQINHLASEFYHYILTKHPAGERGRAYLTDRGVSEKIIKTFTLGYSPGTWETLVRYLSKKGFDAGAMEQAGLAIRSTRGLYDRFRGRVIFTLRDHRGNVVGFAGRQLDPQAKEAKYINSPETMIYSKSNVLYGLDVTKAAIQKEGLAIVTEGEFDVISQFQAGIPNVVAIKGSALTDGHVRLLRRYTERVVLALDGDIAGDAASRRGIDIAQAAGLDVRVAALPAGHDPDDLARTDIRTLKNALTNALSVYDYFITSALSRYDRTTAYGKKKISDEVLAPLGAIDNPIVQAHYVKKLATSLDVSEEVVLESIRKAKKTVVLFSRDVKPEPPVDIRSSSGRPEKLELYILAFLLQGKTADFFEELSEYVKPEEFETMGVRRILERLAGYLTDHNTFLVKDFVDALPKELLTVFDTAFLWDLSGIVENEEILAREWLQTTRELRKMKYRKKIREITTQLQEMTREDSTLNQGTSALQEQLARVTGELRALEKSGIL